MSLDGRPDTPAQRRKLVAIADEIADSLSGLSVQGREYVVQYLRYRLKLRDSVPHPVSRPVRIARATLEARANAAIVEYEDRD